MWLSTLCAPAVGASSRLVSINLCSDQYLIALARRDDIAAVTWMAADPARSAEAAGAQGLAVTHGTAEEIVALRPDLVLADSFSDPNTVALLRELGVTVVRLPPVSDYASIIAATRQVAEAIGARTRGEAVVAGIESAIGTAPSGSIATDTARPVVAVVEPGGYTEGEGTLIDEAMARAGGEGLAHRLGLAGYVSLPLERLVSAEVDLLIVPHETDGSASLSLDALRHPAFVSRFAETPRLALPSNLTDCPAPASAALVPMIRHALGGLARPT